ncbi:unnamed protein product [Protopolystoma xenopodis]|uniref:Uncharacterized protein n=1 Tax=Protopolystoma xenopodis TaxID=117903 RepID=A0A3S5FCH0_9PLAT|nr:unnamed protein product [Protopolystoma xenopodis]
MQVIPAAWDRGSSDAGTARRIAALKTQPYSRAPIGGSVRGQSAHQPKSTQPHCDCLLRLSKLWIYKPLELINFGPSEVASCARKDDTSRPAVKECHWLRLRHGTT